jgi:arylsulfatase A-like enzyme
MTDNMRRGPFRTRLWDFILLALSWGLLGGLLVSFTRIMLQMRGLTSFDLRLVALSPRLMWLGPWSYAAICIVLALGFALLQVLYSRIDWYQPAMIIFGALFFHGFLSATGFLANFAEIILAFGLSATAARILPDGEARSRMVKSFVPWMVAVVFVVGAAVELSTSWAEQRQVNSLALPAPNAPNVVVVIVDTLRADRLSSYGYPKPTSPTISRLAHEGAQFDWAFSSASWSLPSHVSLLTGLYPTEHGAQIERYDGRYPFVSEAFLERGYRTGVISANSVVFSRAWGFGHGFVSFDDSFYSVVDGFTRTIPGTQIHKVVSRAMGWRFHPVKRPAAAVTKAATRWIEKRGDRPFFLVLNYFDVHDPEWPIQPLDGNAYDGAVKYVDDSLNDLVGYLKEQNLLDNTVLVLTSDHGESLGEHDLTGHGDSLYLPEIHVPLIIRYPPVVPPGVRVTTPVSHVSLPATLLQLAGGSGATPIPGLSLEQLWKNGEEVAFWPIPRSELNYRPTRNADRIALTSVNDVPFHFLKSSAGTDELFNIEEDPAETKNLVELQEYAPLVRKYREQLANSNAAVPSQLKSPK